MKKRLGLTLGLAALAIILVTMGVLLAPRIHATRESARTPQLAPMVLNGYDHLPPNIKNAKVQDLNRDDIGTVMTVEVDRIGKPVKIKVLLSKSSKTISVAASDVSYDAQHNIVTIGLDRSEIEKMSE